MIFVSNRVNDIVHIAPDEKFIDAAYDIYERAFPNKNLFLILVDKPKGELKYVSNKVNYEQISLNDNYLKQINEITKHSKLVVYHGMSYHQALLALKLDKENTKYIWSVFGAEVYNNPKIIKNGSIGYETYKRYVESTKERIKDYLRPFYYSIVKRKSEPSKVIKQSFKEMDYAAILYKEEFQKYKELYLLSDKSQHLKFTYYPLDAVIKKETDFVSDSNILIGNSASYTNNHIETFKILKAFDISKREIVCPLSYGNMEYALSIENFGRINFGSSFQSIKNFMALNEYQKILQKCGIVIMNHHRQQAVGNVLNCIYLGSKVYLSKQNTLYHYLKRIGCYIYSVEDDLNQSNKTVFDLLKRDQMVTNRNVLTEEIKLDSVVRELNKNLSPFFLYRNFI